MRPDSTTQFVTAVKLTELRAQRSQLRAAYARLAADQQATTDPYQRFRRLYRGLSDLNYAGKQVHPELADLGVLTSDRLPAGAVATELVERWSSRLLHELTAGRLRSEFVFRFGLLLEQWATSGGTAQPVPPAGQLSALRDKILTPAPPNDHRRLIEELLAGVHGAGLGSCHDDPSYHQTMWMILRVVDSDRYQSAQLRAEARRLLRDESSHSSRTPRRTRPPPGASPRTSSPGEPPSPRVPRPPSPRTGGGSCRSTALTSGSGSARSGS